MRYWLVRSLLSGDVFVLELTAGDLLSFVMRRGLFFEVLKTGPFDSSTEAVVARAGIEGY